MKKNTETIIMSVARGDSTVSPEVLQQLQDVCEGKFLKSRSLLVAAPSRQAPKEVTTKEVRLLLGGGKHPVAYGTLAKLRRDPNFPKPRCQHPTGRGRSQMMFWPYDAVVKYLWPNQEAPEPVEAEAAMEGEG